MPTMWLYALAGGGLIGLAATLLFLTHGRIAGISGIYGSFLPPVAHDLGWRLAFIGGLVLSGVVAAVLAPSAIGAAARSTWVLAVAGLLVGFGSSMGSGCTSGHGVCGLARASARSLVAVMTFMTTGAVTAWLAGGV